MALEVGQVFAGYTILRLLGSGGMGTVYLASHPRLPREDALKVLPADVTDDAEFRARFEREADLAATLSHPHIVGIHDRGEHDGQLWISMEYVEGTDAHHLLSQKFPTGMPIDQVVTIVNAVASALDYAHHLGLLHRDIKPANILLTEPAGQPRRVFLADFGLARRIDDPSGLTRTDVTVGTAAYAAPEQLTGEPLDGRTDQYALACTAYHLLTGGAPYGMSNLASMINQHLTAPPPVISERRPDLAGLDPVFAKAMAKNPADRYESCQEFARHLAQHLSIATQSVEVTQPTIDLKALDIRPPVRDEPKRRPRALLGALIAVAVLLVAGGVFAAVKLTQDEPSGGTAAPTAPPAPPANTGPFTGVYRADFGPPTTLTGEPAPGTKPSSATYAIRSACTSGGCVATASRVKGDPTFASTMVLDQIDGRWLAVALGSQQCRQAPAEVWQVFSLRPEAEGTFTGEYRSEVRNACADKRTVTFTRTGDVDINSLPDPSNQPKRVTSPAESLRGQYHLTRTFATLLPQQQTDLTVTTYCLRTGDRCMSYFYSENEDSPLVFDGANWVLDIGHAETAQGCTDLQVKTTGQYPLPQPAQDPIPLLTGHGNHQQTGNCAVSVDFDEIYARTGD